MRFLVDHQLPVALVRFLKSEGHEAVHVREIGLASALDSTIWQHAASHKMVMISKDEDFLYLAQAQNGQLIWLRLGNCRNQKLIEVFTAQLPAVFAALEAGANIVELR